ncbi:hypothetical protein C2E21_7255 [Chlorella sorokiniana]|uniref:Uncharacterized protein n=1 Tax=Chlorella sorokiniana TaxID=3076 RepID=A0A2P6THS3_CHLSO|nr:hypothetical protein C2E21_7255 [Chlorella sorokiniana]|eukprot:PRW33843.1 hypothetical protein C2E21_7255 [Chlorella sorokiniana]
MQDTSEPTIADQLLEAVLARDHARPSLLLAAVSHDQLAAIESAHLYHATALAGNATAVSLLVAAKVPISAADAQCDGSVLGSWTATEATRQHLQGWSLTALGLATWMGGADVVAALLAEPTLPDQLLEAILECFAARLSLLLAAVSPQRLAAIESAHPYHAAALAGNAEADYLLVVVAMEDRQLTPLGVVVDDPSADSSEEVAWMLLAGGADLAAVSAADVERCAERCPALGSLMRIFKAISSCQAAMLAVLEALLDAGHRPRTFTRAQAAAMRRQPALAEQPDGGFDPLREDPALQLGGSNRWLGLALEHPAWAPAAACHGRFLPSFRAAARALLLVAYHSGSPVAGSSADEGLAADCADSGGGDSGSSEAAAAVGSSASTATASEPLSCAAGLASLPRDVLLHIVGLTAYPLSAWASMDAAVTTAALAEAEEAAAAAEAEEAAAEGHA